MKEEETQAIAVQPEALSAFTAEQVRDQVNLIQHVLQKVMKNNVHYGRIAGCGDKPVLLKAGAEKIMATFRMGVKPEIQDLSTQDEIRYRVITNAFHQPTGTELGSGVGECSSNEKKYKWRSPVCDAEFDAMPESRKRITYKAGYKGNAAREIKQVRTEPADIANTVLKMAKKRSLVDMVLTVTAASDVFDQDIDEEHIAEAIGRESGSGVAEPVQRPQTPPESPQPARDGEFISDKQRGLLFVRMKNSGKTEAAFREYLFGTFGIEHTDKIKRQDFNAVLEWLENGEMSL